MNELSNLQKNHAPNIVESYWVHPPPGLKGLGIKILRKILNHYWRLFENRNYIWRHDGPFEPIVESPCEVVRYENFDDVPYSVKNAILAEGGKKELDCDKFEMEHCAIMWVGFVDGQPAHRKFIRRGKDFKQWFVNLNKNDIVVFRGNTFPKYRGRGIESAVSRHLFYVLLKNGGRAFADCNIHNLSAIRSIQKGGYIKIAEMKPISRKQALGYDE